MSNVQRRLDAIEKRIRPALPIKLDWRERIRREMRGEYVPPDPLDWRAGLTPEEIAALESAGREISQMELSGASADEIIARIEELCGGPARTD